MKRERISFLVQGTVDQVVEFTDETYSAADIRAGRVLTSIGSGSKLLAFEAGRLKEVGRVVSQEASDDMELDFEVLQPGHQRGWVFVDTSHADGGEELGYSAPHEFANAEQAMKGFSDEHDGKFAVYFRDSFGKMNACANGDTEADFD